MLHKVSRTLCKRTVPSLCLHSINVLLANLVSEKCSGSWWKKRRKRETDGRREREREKNKSVLPFWDCKYIFLYSTKKFNKYWNFLKTSTSLQYFLQSLFAIIYRQPQLLFSVKSLRLVDSVCGLCKKQERLLKSSHSYETVKPKYLCGDVSLVFMISDRCQGLVHVNPDNNVPMLWMPDALLGNDASTVKCVAHTLMKGDQWEAWLTSITLKC